jgi:signal peptidase II
MVKNILSISLIIILLDQLTKILTKNINITILPFLKLISVKNTGAAFGIFREFSLLIIFVSIIIIILLIYYINKIPKKDYFAYSLIIGGAIGNLIDRIILGYVRDFISIWIWPVFNIADMAISIGIIIIIFNELKNNYLIDKS